MGLLNREKLLAKEKLDIKKVDLGGGDFVYVRQMTGRERDRFEQSIVVMTKDSQGKANYERSMEDFRAKLAVNTLCDKDGNNLLEPGDYETLSTNISAARLEKIITEAQQLNRISDDDKESLVKNSEAAQEGDSTSG